MRKPKPSARGRARLRKIAREIADATVSFTQVADGAVCMVLDLDRMTAMIADVARAYGVPREQLAGLRRQEAAP